MSKKDDRTKLAKMTAELLELEDMPVRDLRKKWRELFHEETKSRNRRYLIKKLQYRVQELAEGGLSMQARRRILQLAETSPIRHRQSTNAETSPTPAAEPSPAPEGNGALHQTWDEALAEAHQETPGATEAPRPSPTPPATPTTLAEPAPTPPAPPQAHPLDPRLPAPGSTLLREYRGHTFEVQVLADGFEFQGDRFRSLSGIARLITGTSWNGFAFFGLNKKGRSR